MATKKIFKISDEEIRQMYLDGYSIKDIAKVAQDNVGLMALHRRLKSLGVNTTRNMRRYVDKVKHIQYSCNHNFFDVIDTEAKAYWLGFIMADGYNHKSKNCISIRLQEGDSGHLEKFKEAIEYDGSIHFYKNGQHRACDITIQSQQLCDSLIKHNCIQAKTYNTIPIILPEPLMQHYIRGWFDDDGCVHKGLSHERGRNPRFRYQWTLVGDPKAMKMLAQYLAKQLNISEMSLTGTKNNFAKTIHYGGRRNVQKIMDYLYLNATIYLQRKYDYYYNEIGNAVE